MCMVDRPNLSQEQILRLPSVVRVVGKAAENWTELERLASFLEYMTTHMYASYWGC